jgi:hypothetical protein
MLKPFSPMAPGMLSQAEFLKAFSKNNTEHKAGHNATYREYLNLSYPV